MLKTPSQTCTVLAAILLGIISGWGSATAGGLLGDAINVIAPGVGTALDDVHRDIKEAIPPYKAIEEGVSNTVNETIVQSTAPLLQDAIARSRDDAISAGVQPIPPAVRQNLQGFVQDRILSVARFRVGGGGDLSLQVNAIRYGEAAAITLDYVIVFANENDAMYNAVLWTHELAHVRQYQDWGMKDFAIRYVRSYSSVEKEAYDEETRYLAWTAVQNGQQMPNSSSSLEMAVNRPVVPFFGVGSSNTCGTSFGTCGMPYPAPVGTPCWCNGPYGAAVGALVPSQPIPASMPAGFPSGQAMQGCGCWGPNPVPFAPEARCQSGGVRVQVCMGMCAPGHPAYGYVCN